MHKLQSSRAVLHLLLSNKLTSDFNSSSTVAISACLCCCHSDGKCVLSLHQPKPNLPCLAGAGDTLTTFD